MQTISYLRKYIYKYTVWLRSGLILSVVDINHIFQKMYNKNKYKIYKKIFINKIHASFNNKHLLQITYCDILLSIGKYLIVIYYPPTYCLLGRHEGRRGNLMENMELFMNSPKLYIAFSTKNGLNYINRLGFGSK